LILSTQEILHQLARSHPVVQFLLIAVSSAFTEEVAVIGILGLARAGQISWILALCAIFIGTTTMNIGLYLCGRVAGQRALNWAIFRKFRENGSFDTLHKHVDKEGWVAVAIARFVPGTRFPVFVLSGILGMEWHKFVLTMLISTVLWLIAALGLLHFVMEMAKEQPVLLGTMLVVLVAIVLFRLRRRQGASGVVGSSDGKKSGEDPAE
jgi:membrane protein DedA with SNARE-associated domain